MIFIGTADETDQEIAEIDMRTGIDHQIGGDAEVETGTIETGETILMTGLQGAARTLLTHGPVAEEMVNLVNLQADQRVSKPSR